MRRSPLSPVDQTRMISFDGGIAEPMMRQRPDRYRLLQAAVCSGLAACCYKKIYSSTRMFVSWVYNKLLPFMFRTSFR